MNFRDKKVIYVARRIVIRKKLKKLISKKLYNIKLTRKQKNDYLRFWKKYFKHPSLVWVKMFYKITGNFDVKYVPEDYFYAYINRIINERQYSSYASDKNKFDLIFAGFKAPETIGRKINGFYFDKNYLPVKLEQILSTTRQYSRIIVKPSRDSSQGKGIRAFYTADENFDYELKNFLESNGNDLIVQNVIDSQYKPLKDLNSASINTIKIMSYFDNQGVVHILSRYVRFGSPNSGVTDNTHQGGGTCGFDENGNFYDCGFISNYKIISTNFESRPLSSFHLDKQVITKVDDFVKLLHYRVPNFRIASWDICVLEDGSPCFIEMNVNNPVLNEHQLFNGPIFKEFTEEILSQIKL